MQDDIIPVSGSDGPDAPRRDHLRALILSARSQAANAVRTTGDSHGSASRSAVGVAEGSSTGRVLAACLPGYELLREVHRGGQGLVYEAIQTSTRRRVAIKVMREGPFAGEADLARFEREVQILAQLHHPSIVTIHDSGQAAGHFYFVMDLIAGRPLDEYARDSGRSMPGHDAASPPRADIGTILRLFVQTCDAVNAAHLRGVIHRDVKPGNILVDADGVPHVLDFGLAKATVALSHDGETAVGRRSAAGPRATTMAGQFLGSLPWASPEQVAGDVGVLDIRTDVYSLGVMLYQALTGRFPYDVLGSLSEVMHRITHAEPVRPRTVRSDIDDEVETIVLKCLQKDPARRYQSAGDLARDLQRYLAGEPVEAKTDSALYVLRKTLRRYRAPLGVLALFILLLAGSTTVALLLSLRANRAAADAREANAATAVAQQRAEASLHASLIAQARAVRRSGLQGCREEALLALRQAAAMDPTLEVRNEVIASLAVVDLSPIRRLAERGTGYYDHDLVRCAVAHADGSVTVVRVADDARLAHVPCPASGLKDLHGMMLRWPHLVRTFDPPTGPRRLELWDLAAGRLALELDDVPFRSRFDISADRARLAVGRLDGAIHIYDLATMQEVQRVALERMPGYLAFDPSGRRLLLYHAEFSAPEMLELDTGRRSRVFESTGIGWAAAWDPRGRWVAGAADNNIELWDLAEGRRAAVLAGHEARIVHLAASNDGSMLLSFAWDGYAALWDVRTRRLLLRIGMVRPVFGPGDREVAATAFEGKGEVPTIMRLEGAAPRRLLASWDDVTSTSIGGGGFEPHTGSLFLISRISEGTTRLRVYDPATGDELAAQTIKAGHGLAMEGAGRFLLATQDDGVYRWPIAADDAGLSIGPPALVSAASNLELLAMTPDGTLALSGVGYTGSFKLTDLVSGEERRLEVGRRVGSVRISADGRWLAICTWYGGVAEVYETATGRRVAELPTGDFLAVELTADGRGILTSDGTHITEWELGTWRRIRQSPQQAIFRCVSPDGRMLVVSPDSTRIRLLDYQTLEEIATLEPPEAFHTQACAFNPDGTLLAQVTNRSGVVHLWDLRRIREQLAAMNLDWDAPPFPAASGERRPIPGVSFLAAPP
jgi:serine/threonine protein kinase/WD40 repeat protein